MFELNEFTKVRVLDVRTLASKDRKPDEKAGAQLLLRATLPSSALSMLDGSLAGWLYQKAGAKKQSALDGMEGAELTTIGEHVKRLPWLYDQTGCEVCIDRGIGGKSNLDLDDCRAHRLSVTPQESGSVWQWTLDIPGLSDDTRGKLSGLKATDISMTMHGPAPDAQTDIEDKPAPAAKKATKVQQSATDAFIEKNTAGAGAH